LLGGRFQRYRSLTFRRRPHNFSRPLIDQNFGQLKGARSYEVAAEKSGFGNAETYRQAKAVVAARLTRKAMSLLIRLGRQ
jgi:hypothetical protein